MALLLGCKERMGVWVGAVTSLGTLNNEDLLPLLGSEPWTVQPIAWSLFGLQLHHPLIPPQLSAISCVPLIMIVILQCLSYIQVHRGADKSLARPGRKQATVTEDFEFHISYL